MEGELRRLIIEQHELLIRLIYRKMTPASCTDKIQIFETREEYNKLMKINWEIEQYL